MLIVNRLEDDLNHVLKHTEGLWEEIRGKRIFITGGTGYFGCWLLESFAWANQKLDLNASALVLTRDVEHFRKKAPHLTDNPSIEFHIGDVRLFDFPAGEFSHIIHAATAASAKLNKEDPLLMLDTIIDGTRRTLNFAVQCGAKKLLLTSSGAVYGKQPPEMIHIPETYTGGPDPMNSYFAYAEGKRVSELLCAIYFKKFGIESKIARCFAQVGPYLPLNIHYAMGNFIRDAINGGPIVVQGDGTPNRSYLYASDLIIWLWTILFRGRPCRPYNLGSEQSMSILETARAVGAVADGTITISVAKKPDPEQDVQRYVPDTTLARSELGLKQTVSIDEAIDRTLKWASDISSKDTEI
jgi:dTDP-glucose 4,6-dehydratase